MTGPELFSDEEGMEMRPLAPVKTPYQAKRRMPPGLLIERATAVLNDRARYTPGGGVYLGASEAEPVYH